MGFSARVLADSVSEEGYRLTTVEATFPRCILAEVNTHRVFSRNAASSRAIPISKMITAVEEDPFIPLVWGRNQAGMQARGELEGEDKERAAAEWLRARNRALESARRLDAGLHVHKQVVNRLLEPWMWTTMIISATEWENFLALRQDREIRPHYGMTLRDRINLDFPAEPHMQVVAHMIREVMEGSEPEMLQQGQWHLPLYAIDAEDSAALDAYLLEKEAGVRTLLASYISAGRSARVSYLTHDGKRDPQADVDLCERLVSDVHMSPLEHPATPDPDPAQWANFNGWKQLRRTIPGESGRKGV